MKIKGSLTSKRRPHLLSLEPRMMFDAAAAITLQDAVTKADNVDHGAMDGPDPSLSL